MEPTENSPSSSSRRPLHELFLWLCRQARRVIVFVIGLTVLLIGIAMIVGPGPAVVVIPLGLAILATEFVWARKWLDYAKRQLNLLSPYSTKPSAENSDAPIAK